MGDETSASRRAKQATSQALASAAAVAAAATAGPDQRRQRVAVSERLLSQQRHFPSELGALETGSAAYASFLVEYKRSAALHVAPLTGDAIAAGSRTSSRTAITKRTGHVDPRGNSDRSVAPRPDAVREARDFVCSMLAREGKEHGGSGRGQWGRQLDPTYRSTNIGPMHSKHQTTTMTPLRRAKTLIGDEWAELSTAQRTAAVEKVAQIYPPEDDAAWHGAEKITVARRERRQRARQNEEALDRARSIIAYRLGDTTAAAAASVGETGRATTKIFR